VGRIYDEVKGRPLYIVAEALGYSEEQRAQAERWGRK
jgi:hypothetical protein